MHRPFSRAVALLALASALVLGVSQPATAYAPDGAVTVSSTTVGPGGSVGLRAADGTFEPGEAVTITVQGENASGVTFALVRTVVETKTYSDARANAAGGLDTVTVTFPQNASGAYTIAVFSPSSSGGTVTVTVGALSSTGLDSQSLIGIWVGGAALVLAGIVVIVAVMVSRWRRAADAA